jgi:hypothetical protein
LDHGKNLPLKKSNTGPVEIDVSTASSGPIFPQKIGAFLERTLTTKRDPTCRAQQNSQYKAICISDRRQRFDSGQRANLFLWNDVIPPSQKN